MNVRLLVEGPATAEAIVIGGLVGAGIGALLGATVFAPSGRPSPSSDDALAVLADPGRSAVTLMGKVRVGP